MTNEMPGSKSEEKPEASTGRRVGPAGSPGSERGERGQFRAVEAELARFWRRVDRTSTPDGCWVWLGRTTADGYPVFDRARPAGPVRAHRFGWELANGPLAEGLTLDHLVEPDGPCTSTLCVRPDHLEPVTNPENVRRRHARRRAQEPQ